MNAEAQRIAIATACGWKLCKDQMTWLHPHARIKTEMEGNGIEGYWCVAELLPDYLNDLNAMHEAEKMLVSQDQKIEYLEQLYVLNFKGDQNPDTFIEQVFSTAAQRAEAFLKTLNLWKE